MESHDHRAEQRPRNWRNWALGIAVLVAIIFVAQNSQSVKVKFLFVDTTAPLIFLLVITVLLGMIIGYVTPIVRSRQRDHEQR